MPDHRPNGAVVLVTRLARAAYRDVDEAALGMKLKSFTALSALRDTGGDRGQKELGEALLLDANNLTLLLNELEDAGLVTRARDPHDRRRHIVQLTDAGREAVRGAEQAIDRADASVLGRLSERERMQLGGLLAKALGDDARA